MLEAFFSSFFLVFISEMGDKTQLLVLVLTARFKRPWTILSGVLIATILNHGLAAWAGGWASSLLSPSELKWTLVLVFIVFAVWLLIPDKDEQLRATGYGGAFLTTIVAFFFAEMGDKTQLATIALGARYASPLLVTIGSTVGMVGANALAVFLGERLLKQVPMKWVRLAASALFILFGILIALAV